MRANSTTRRSTWPLGRAGARRLRGERDQDDGRRGSSIAAPRVRWALGVARKQERNRQSPTYSVIRATTRDVGFLFLGGGWGVGGLGVWDGFNVGGWREAKLRPVAGR